MTDIDYILKFSDKCCAEVSRQGIAQPCDKTAVADGSEEYGEGNWWPVCAYHARGAMVPLAELIGAVRVAVEA